jgi:hypothetical protein
VVVTTGNRTLDFLNGISAVVAPKGIRQVHFQTSGFFGAFYLDGGAHSVIEGDSTTSYPNSEVRILNPWPALQEFWDSFDPAALDETQYAHQLAYAILNRANREVREELGVPMLTFQHRGALQMKIESYRRPKPNPEPGTFPFEPAECIDEAIDKIALGYGRPYPPPNPVELFALIDAGAVPADTADPFWQLARATNNFFKRHGVLPHYGDCPDCEALPEYFRRQKEVYRAKREADWAEVLADPCITVPIDPDFAKRFADNVWAISGFVYERIGAYLERRPSPCWDPSDLDAANAVACVQLLFIAARRFLAQRGRSPGVGDEAEIEALILELGAPADKAPAFAHEFCRYNGSVLPSVVASLAAVLAGEVTKLIIRQAIPAKGLVVYDALNGQLREA